MANRSLFKPIHTSGGEAYAPADAEFGATVMDYAASTQQGAGRKHEGFSSDWTKEYDRPVNEIDELHNHAITSFGITSTSCFPNDGHRDCQEIHCLSAIDSPTLVPCPTPVLTPGQSLCHIHAPIEAERLVYQHESLVERILMASCASDSSDEAEEPEDILLSDRDCFRFDDSKTTLDMDDPLADLPVEIPKRCPTPVPASARKPTGLDISGLSQRTVAEPFNGLGLVSIHRSKRYKATNHRSASVEDLDKGGYDSSGTSSASSSTDSISSTILKETLLTLTDDPFHVHALNAIPECRSWYEIDELIASSISSPTGHMFVTPSPRTDIGSPGISTRSKYRIPHAYRQDTSNILSLQNKDVQHGHMHCSRVGARHGPSRIAKPNFQSATISSELKRSTSTLVQEPRTNAGGPTRRARSATWPDRNKTKPRGQTEELSSESPSKAAMGSQRRISFWRV